MPDFDRLHRDLDLEMTRTRSNMRRQLTVPHEFKLNGANPQEQQERGGGGGVGLGAEARGGVEFPVEGTLLWHEVASEGTV